MSALSYLIIHNEVVGTILNLLTLQLGTILSFMMAVTTLSLPSMIMLKKAVKPKLLGVFITICATGIIIVGYVFNAFHVFLM
ncbi:MAG: permease [Coprococcus phoceensis]